MIQPCVAYINSLTYAEIYIAMAMLVMRFDYELFETGTEDVEFQHFFYGAASEVGAGICERVGE
jgi:hypothetical protein